ncbi:hypothetical protein F8C76_02290 [Flagellimonas olearia]|uniref:Dienelactone hydrolase domain-containing protein n=1 Tax=Flagellimonas olearia TaxID=552546 RepID=A0A6I1E1P4_9FLAO|nr:hypothetical protein [Allomuricauda olearia]KAB7530359.1 hypothetical protein F8C76_02290 [Allomuricauda olearia]
MGIIRHRSLFISTLYCFFFTSWILAQKTVTFHSKDGLNVTADLYIIEENAPYIVLAHLSQHSRGEYKNTAAKFNAVGFNCLAVDTRTGNEALGVVNETAQEAKKLGLPTDFLSSEQDIVASIDYVYELNNNDPILLLGSSFSASLALKIGASNPKVKAVMAFSPGEYFGNKLNLKSEVSGFSKPLFVASSKKEAPDVTDLIDHLSSDIKVQFIPDGEGAHGSIALWDYNDNHVEYWTALIDFLAPFKP